MKSAYREAEREGDLVVMEMLKVIPAETCEHIFASTIDKAIDNKDDKRASINFLYWRRINYELHIRAHSQRDTWMNNEVKKAINLHARIGNTYGLDTTKRHIYRALAKCWSLTSFDETAYVILDFFCNLSPGAHEKKMILDCLREAINNNFPLDRLYLHYQIAAQMRPRDKEAHKYLGLDIAKWLAIARVNNLFAEDVDQLSREMIILQSLNGASEVVFAYMEMASIKMMTLDKHVSVLIEMIEDHDFLKNQLSSNYHYENHHHANREQCSKELIVDLWPTVNTWSDIVVLNKVHNELQETIEAWRNSVDGDAQSIPIRLKAKVGDNDNSCFDMVKYF